MQVKLIKNTGYYRLVVDDKEMNEKYGCSNDEPIILAKLEEFAGTGFWKVKDLRLAYHANGGADPFFEGTAQQKYTPKDEEDRKKLISRLHTYREENGVVHWSTFDGIAAFGDKSNEANLPNTLKKRNEGAWSFQAGMDKLNEIRQFWENYSENNLDNIAINNPYRQPTVDEYKFDLPLDIQESPKMKP